MSWSYAAEVPGLGERLLSNELVRAATAEMFVLKMISLWHLGHSKVIVRT